MTLLYGSSMGSRPGSDIISSSITFFNGYFKCELYFSVSAIMIIDCNQNFITYFAVVAIVALRKFPIVKLKR